MEQWDAVDPLSVNDAAFLWKRLQPCADFSSAPSAYQTAKRIWSAAQQLNLFTGKMSFNAGYEISRADLKRIAEVLHETPHFLYLDKRRKKTGWSKGNRAVYQNCYLAIEKIKKTKGCNVSRAAQLAAKELDIPAATVERNYRRVLVKQEQ